jgi:ACR3 family arsenite transporter
MIIDHNPIRALTPRHSPVPSSSSSRWTVAGSRSGRRPSRGGREFLGIPLITGFLTRRLGEKARGRTWYETELIRRIGPFALYGLLFTIVVLFALQGEAITSQPLDVVRIAPPLLVYFALMWAGSMALGKAVGVGNPRATTLAFTAAGNNFELAIAVAIATSA